MATNDRVRSVDMVHRPAHKEEGGYVHEQYLVITRWEFSGTSEVVAFSDNALAADTLLTEWVDYYVSEGLMKGSGDAL